MQNYLGFSMISGFELAEKFNEHVHQFNVPTVDDRVASVRKTGNTFLVTTKDGKEFESRAVLITSGRSARNLGVPGEEEYKGKGIAYCATCDAPLYADENVVVVGGGNAGLDAAMQLAKIARSVHIIEESPQLAADKYLQNRVVTSVNTHVHTDTEVTKVAGNKLVEGITIRNLKTGKEEDIPVAGVFVEIGSQPNVDFLPPEVQINERKEIVIDCLNCASLPGLFAAGDCTSIPHKQIIIAAGEGAKACLMAKKYIVKNFADGG